ncbi:Chromosome partition protein Smc [uncultured archaeon]|nr:Chromosome partition protein Smc [uncultured archaeon]
MLTPQEKQQIKVQIDALQKDIKELKSTLNQIDEQKEKVFADRKTLGRQIATSIKEIKQLRHERDSLTAEVKTAKEERAKLAAVIKEKIDAFKKIHGEKKQAEPKNGVRESPGKLRQEIERMEYKIETEGLSFDKEQKLMKIINAMKKRLKEAEALSGAYGEARELSREIDKLKNAADEFHAKIQEKAKVSQEKHEKLMEISKKVDEWKKQEEEMNKQIEAKKKEIDEKCPPLDEKIKQYSELKLKIGEEVKEEKLRTVEQKKKKLSELQQEVQEKLRKGEKLTTQDLLIMQSIDE